jgi:hypothetical protein
MEKLKSDEQREIIQNLINLISNEDPSLYYTDSSTIAALVHEKVHTAEVLNRQKFDVVKDLSADDILILMSYRSSCC